MNTHESGSLYRRGRFSLRRKARPVRLSPPQTTLAQRRWLLPGALGVLVVGVLAGGSLAVFGLPVSGHATLTPAHALGTPEPTTPQPAAPQPAAPQPGSPLPGSPLPTPDASPGPSGDGAGDPVVPAVGVLYTVSSRCLDIAGTDNGASAQITDCDGSDQQRWRLDKGAGNQYVITDAATGKCLAVENGSRDDGARVLHSDCHDGAEQRWLVHWQTDTHSDTQTGTQTGAFTLANVNSGMCAAVEGGGTVRQHECGDDDSQRWSVRN